MDRLVQLWIWFNAYTKINPIVSGLVGVWGLSMLTLVCRKIPMRILNWVYAQSTTTLDFDNSDVGFMNENYLAFMHWLVEQKYARFTRHFSLITTGRLIETLMQEGKTAALGAGLGTHWFFYKGRLFKVNRRMIEKQGERASMFAVYVTMFGRKRAIMQTLLDEFSYRTDTEKLNVYRYKWHEGYWSSNVLAQKRSLESVIIDPAIKAKIVADIEKFQQEEAWYKSRGLPWKLMINLHGVPGTGKTSFVRAIASHFKLSIAILDLNELSDQHLLHAISSLPKNCLLLLEDFDSCPAVLRRDSLRLKDTEKDDESSPPYFTGKKDVTLSGILNAFDGVVGMDGVIGFTTTNVLDQIDPAILRKGRTDYIYELGKLRHAEVVSYLELMFPASFIPNNMYFEDILGCDLQAIYFEHHESVFEFVAHLPLKAAPEHAQLKAA